jgi:hypothetical protein
MAISRLITDNYPVRIKRYLEVLRTGAVDAHRHLAPRRKRCHFCCGKESRGLNVLRSRSGAEFHVGPDCLKAYNALEASDIPALERLIR